MRVMPDPQTCDSTEKSLSRHKKTSRMPFYQERHPLRSPEARSLGGEAAGSSQIRLLPDLADGCARKEVPREEKWDRWDSSIGDVRFTRYSSSID